MRYLSPFTRLGGGCLGYVGGRLGSNSQRTCSSAFGRHNAQVCADPNDAMPEPPAQLLKRENEVLRGMLAEHVENLDASHNFGAIR
jgi:hypothetical protein